MLSVEDPAESDQSPEKNTDKLFVVNIIKFVLVLVVIVITFAAIITVLLIARPEVNMELPLHRATLYNNLTEYPTPSNIEMLSLGQETEEADGFKLVCYYNFPGLDKRSLPADRLEPFLCTHINVAFATVVNNSIHLEEDQLEVLMGVIDLKKKNPDLKVLLSVGGAGGNTGFPEMVSNHSNRKTFIHSIVELVKTHKLDGIDLDWEFPNEITTNDKYQKMHFTQLLLEIRKTIQKQDPLHKHKFLLTVAVAAPDVLVDTSYDVFYLNDAVDFVNVMTYDYHFYTKYTPFTGLNSPLYATCNEKSFFSNMNINHSANYWFSKGMDRKKIVLGLPTYGHSFKLINKKNNGLYAPASGYGSLGTNGFVDYMQVCDFLESNSLSPVFDVNSKSPYAYKDLEWLSFDDERSLAFKAEFIRDNNLGGAMIYSLNSDDHKATCGQCFRMIWGFCELFPLTKSVKRVLSEQYS